MTPPQLRLVPEHRAEIQEHYEEVTPSLSRYFALQDATEGDDLAAAHGVAALLEGVVHSSDTDCAYYPCVLATVDPSSDAFFAALGVARDARADVSGYDNPKLEVVRAGDGDERRPTFALLTRLGDYELQRLNEYVEEPDLSALRSAAAALAAIGPVVGIQLCTDEGVGKIVLTVAERSPGIYAGVLTIRIET
jgi:hypothetical protein